MINNFNRFVTEKVKPGFWTKENLQKEADKYKTRTDFYKKNPSAYGLASNKRLIDELFKNHPNQGYDKNRKKDGYWTKENLQKEVDKYNTRLELRKNNYAAYVSAKKQKLLDELFKNHINNGYLNKEEWKENSYVIYSYELLDYNQVYVGLTNNLKRRDMEHLWSVKTKLSQFCKKNNISLPKYKILEENLNSINAKNKEKYWFDFYKNNGWKMFNSAKPGSLGGTRKKWTKKKLQKEANKYQNKYDFRKNNKQAYNAASQYKLIDYLFRNHPNQGQYINNRWTKEKLQEEANKSKSRKDFRDNYRKAYIMAKEYKIMDELFKNHPNQGYQK